MTLAQFLEQLKSSPDQITFADTMAVIDRYYDYAPTSFINADLRNAAGENQGSCKLFAFALAQQLSEAETLACFGDYYRVDVLQNPDGTDHNNIRNFIRSGWQGIRFLGQALTQKP